jgi:hypothetical protein
MFFVCEEFNISPDLNTTRENQLISRYIAVGAVKHEHVFALTCEATMTGHANTTLKNTLTNLVMWSFALEHEGVDEEERHTDVMWYGLPGKQKDCCLKACGDDAWIGRNGGSFDRPLNRDKVIRTMTLLNQIVKYLD